jgi:hypothetical protein
MGESMGENPTSHKPAARRRGVESVDSIVAPRCRLWRRNANPAGDLET